MDKSCDRTVLVVDDSAEYADNLRQILTGAGYRVLVAVSGQAATELAAVESFCVAIVDSRLPDIDGASLASALKTCRPQSEIILFTGASVIGATMTAMNTEVWACLTKPCPTEALLTILREAMQQAMLHEEKRALAERVLIAEKLATAGALSAGLSHEIRNPLNSTVLQLALLERRVRRIPSDFQPELLDPIAAVRQEIERLSRLLDDFLEFARPREVNPTQVDLAEVASSVQTLLKPQALEAGLRLECQGSSAHRILGESDRLRQAVLNLVLNAIQATPAGGTVRIEVGDVNSEVFLAVTDTGPGVPLALRPRIFEPFYTTKQTGTGLGLPIVYTIVRRYGGSLTLDDVLGSGARFVMKFARADA